MSNRPTEYAVNRISPPIPPLVPLSRLGAIIGLAAALILLTPFIRPGSPTARTPRGQGVFYVVPVGDSFEFRVYPPGRDPIVVGTAESKPGNIFWRDDFSEWFYQIGNRMMKRGWNTGSAESKSLVFPEGTDSSGTFWIDDDSGRWRYFRIAWPEETAEVYEYSARKKKWKSLASAPTHGCKSGDDSTCGLEVRPFTKGKKRSVRLEDLSHEMKVWSHLSKLGVRIKNDRSSWPFLLPSSNQPDASIEVIVGLGETLHGIAPLSRVSKTDGSKIEIYGASEPGCPTEVAFREYDRWILAAGEGSGRCGRIADLREGKMLFRLPADSVGAVWVPLPD